MTVAFDAATTNESALDPHDFTHTPVGTPRGVILLGTSNGIGAGDFIVGITYGGVSMSRIKYAASASAEPGQSWIYFLGASIPTGAQTVSIDKNSASTLQAVSVTLTAGADTEIVDSDSTVTEAADPQLTLQLSGRSSMAFACIHSGANAPTDLTAIADQTALATRDWGTKSSVYTRTTTAQTADDTIGWTALIDDVSMSAAAIAEVVAAAGRHHLNLPLIGVG